MTDEKVEQYLKRIQKADKEGIPGVYGGLPWGKDFGEKLGYGGMPEPPQKIAKERLIAEWKDKYGSKPMGAGLLVDIGNLSMVDEGALPAAIEDIRKKI